MTEKKLIFFTPEKKETPGQWLVDQEISAGFPSPADDFKEIRISLDRELVKNEEATFYAKVSGDSMIGAGLDDGDLLVIDRSLNPENGKIAVCLIDGEFTVKRLKLKNKEIYLMPENSKYSPIKIGDGNELQDHGIETRYNLPGVGKNLQDHLQVRPIYKCDASTINTEKQNLLKLLGMAFQYAAMRSGPMAMAARNWRPVTGVLATQASSAGTVCMPGWPLQN